MKKFENFTGKMVILNQDNIDTDKIIPKQFLTTVTEKGLGKHLFYELRYDSNNNLIKDSIFNNLKNQNNLILISKKNFGCGSSREHAPWAILDFGFKVVIAESFADIFYNNSFKNGLLLVKLTESEINELIDYSNNNYSLNIDLNNQEIQLKNNQNNLIKKYNFEIDEFKKYCLLNGLDEIGIILDKENKNKIITNFELNRKKQQSWL